MFRQASLFVGAIVLIAGVNRPSVCLAGDDARTGPNREAEERRADQLASGPVATPKKRTVVAALVWLSSHQAADGSWSLHDYTKQCKDKTCTGQSDISSDAGATALGLLPFLAAGQTHKSKGPYKEHIRKGLDWLIRHQEPDGNLAKGSTQMMHGHGLATIALSEAYGLTGDRDTGTAAQKAVNFILAAQNPKDGGWRYNPGDPGDTCVLGWQLAALKSAHMAGLNVGRDVFANASKYLDSAAIRGGTEYGYQPECASSPSMTAVGLLGRQYLGATRDSAMLTGGMKYLMSHLPDENLPNIYYWYYATQVMHNMNGPDWDTWNRKTRDLLVRTQVRNVDECAHGSWNPAKDAWGRQGGRLMTTSLSTLTLVVYYRYLPLFKREASGRVDGAAGVTIDRDAALTNLKRETEALRQAVLREDHSKLAGLTCPCVVEAMGGREKFIKRLTAIADEMKRSGFRFASIKMSGPRDFKQSSGELYSIIPQDLQLISSDGDRIDKHSYLICVSFDRGATWKFLDGQGIGTDRKKLELVLPNFPKDLRLPDEH